MLNLFGFDLSIEVIKSFLGDAAGNTFIQMSSIFALVAFIHAGQMRREIRAQFTELIGVLREDLQSTRDMLGSLTIRVDRIEHKMAPSAPPKDLA